jgi:hypothetical protein
MEKYSFKKITSVLLVAVIVFSLFSFSNPKKAEAISVADAASKCGLGSLLGGITGKIGSMASSLTSSEIPVKASGVEEKTSEVTTRTCVNYILEAAFNTALAALKKRLLDKVTDDIIGWIQDGKEPRFVSNFGDFMKDTADEAVGQTIQDIGMGQLCYASLKVQLQLTVKPRPRQFSRAVSCTLSDVVKNVAAFGQDFQQGGWAGYQELLNPRNNRFGLQLMVMDRVAAQANFKLQASLQKAQAGSGFLPVERCIQWSRTAYDPSIDDISPDMDILVPGQSATLTNVPWNDTYYDPTTPPPNSSNTSSYSAESNWSCTNRDTTLPGRTTAAITDTAASGAQDTHYLINSNDLEPYISAIFDAAVNRITKAGVQGLKSATQNLFSQSSTGQAPVTYASQIPAGTDCNAVLANPTGYATSTVTNCRYSTYGSTYAASTNLSAQLKTGIKNAITSTTAALAIATVRIRHIIDLNDELVATSTDLIACETTFPYNNACPNSTTILTNSQNRQTSLAATLDDFTNKIPNQLIQIGGAAATPNQTEAILQTLYSTIASIYANVDTTSGNFTSIEQSIRSDLLYAKGRLGDCKTTSYICK